MQTNFFTLPEISFVGGESQEFSFHLKNPNGQPFDARDAYSSFDICEYSNNTGTPIKSYTPEILIDAAGYGSILHVEIPKVDTAEMYGKYIYQITIIDVNGTSEIPNQGIMNIAKNINSGYITQQN